MLTAMEKYALTNDVKLMCMTAVSFPNGIVLAFQQLRSLLPDPTGRKFFGISRPDKTGTIIYKAAVEQLNDQEGAFLGLENMILPKGIYISSYISNYQDNIPAIRQTFDVLTALPDIARDGYCVEMYVGDKDVRCMILLKL